LKKILVPLLLLIIIVVACSPANGVVHRKIEPLPSSEFTPIPPIFANMQDPDVVAPSPLITAKPTDKPAVKRAPKITTLQGIRHGSILIKGLASWYCKAGVSICHHSYPPGSMVAAACSPLRKSLGPNWRGKYVVVATKTRAVVVKLVDWCGSPTKTIDLYWEPMRRLGGTGVLHVTIYRR